MKQLILAAFTFSYLSLYADIKVSNVEVFSGYPWKEVVIGYTIQGADDTTGIRLSATDKSANKTYTAQSLIGAELTDGRHILRWNASSEGVKFASANVVFVVSAVELGVQLWENGPYWAECNVGASKPEDYGYYFWWGDTVGYKRNAANDGWVSVKDGSAFSFSSGNCPTYDKTNSQLQSAGYVDSTGNLVAKYDAATKWIGPSWRMPTSAEFLELSSNCTATWTKRNGVSGQLVTGKGAYASKSVFFPAAGLGYVSIFKFPGSNGYYWTSTPNSAYSYRAGYLYLDSDSFYQSNYGGDRGYGQSVRPVRGFAK